jgi:hypothetical protein
MPGEGMAILLGVPPRLTFWMGIEELLRLAKALFGKHDRLLACWIIDTLRLI